MKLTNGLRSGDWARTVAPALACTRTRRSSPTFVTSAKRVTAIRSEARAEVIEERPRIYERETPPVLSLFREADVPIHRIVGAAAGKAPQRIVRLVNEA